MFVHINGRLAALETRVQAWNKGDVLRLIAVWR
jgi:hypothetical protein